MDAMDSFALDVANELDRLGLRPPGKHLPSVCDAPRTQGALQLAQFALLRLPDPEFHEWLDARHGFADVRSAATTDDSVSINIYHLEPRQPPPIVFHATPQGRWDDIQQSGCIRPGRETNCSSSGVLHCWPDAERWVHMFESIEDAVTNWLQKHDCREHLQTGDWVVLEIDGGGVQHYSCDPRSRSGFVTPDAISTCWVRAIYPVPCGPLGSGHSGRQPWPGY
jgi:hypothetical protein